MIKKIGFLVIILGVAVALRPSFFKSLIGMESTDKEILKDEIFEQETQYAEGYDANSFGAAFTSDTEEMFPVEDQEPPKGAWGTLLELDFKYKYNEEVDAVLSEPKFTKKIEALEGQIIEVDGFIIPQDIAATSPVTGDKTDGRSFMFSAYPIASCFFCGGAGAESVLETFPKEPIPYTKSKITIRGRLRFNRIDFLQLPYILEDVEMIEKDL